MLELEISEVAISFIENLPEKHARQVMSRIYRLQENPLSPSSGALIGKPPFRREKAGEYRIIYKIEGVALIIAFIGKRNDDEVYRLFDRL